MTNCQGVEIIIIITNVRWGLGGGGGGAETTTLLLARKQAGIWRWLYFFPRTISEWNCLPPEVVSSASVETFKSRIHEELHHGSNSKRRELAQHVLSRGSHAFTHTLTYINTVTTTSCEAPAQLLQNLESNFLFGRYLDVSQATEHFQPRSQLIHNQGFR